MKIKTQIRVYGNALYVYIPDAGKKAICKLDRFKEWLSISEGLPGRERQPIYLCDKEL